jgi:predicted RNA binding protein YcfA (HicA-like mRNA interferase family)
MTDYLKQVKNELEKAGFEFIRHGKGSHDVWRNAKTRNTPTAVSAGTPFRQSNFERSWN